MDFWLHTGRWLQDLDIWREVVIVRLPDGTVVGHRAYGNGLDRADGPGGANFAIRVAEDRRRFTLHFHGAARRVQAIALAGALLEDGPVERLAFDLEFVSDRPIWDMHGVSDKQDFAGTGHVEQLGTIRGSIAVGRDRFDYDGLGHRDHSRGPRDSSRLGRHHWAQGLFDDGIGFAIYHAVLRGETEPAFAKAVVWDGDTLFPATVTLPWMIDNALDATRPFPIRLDYEQGTLDITAARLTSTAFLSFSAPNEEYVGVFPASDGGKPIVLLEQSALYTRADGVAGHGMVERSVPGEAHRERE